MKRLVPLLSAVTALVAIALVTAVAVGASSDDLGGDVRQNDEATDGDVAAACLEGTVDCNDTLEGEDARCAEDAVDCADTTGSGSMNMCAAPDNPGADPVAAPECGDMIDCAAVEDAACDDPMPVEPGMAVDPICIDDGTGECIDDGSRPPSTEPSSPSGVTTTYDLTIAFNDLVTQADIDETIKVITGISPDTEFLVRESFPPVGVARITTDMASFCPDIEAKLESSSYMADVTCAASITSDGNPPPDPDAPISSEPAAIGSPE